MEYTVGSIADLISGKHTPNKPKVKKQKLALPNIETDFEPVDQKPQKNNEHIKKKKQNKISPSSGDSNIVVIKPEMFSNVPKTENSVPLISDIDGETKKKPKKRKRNVSIEHSTSKRSKNEKSAVDPNNDSGETAVPKKTKKKSQRIVTGDVKEQLNTKESTLAKAERDSRTVFVGNVPITIKKRQLLRLFAKYGHVESVRLRCIAPAEPGIPKRVAFIKKLMHPKRLTMHSYITFALRDDALKALAQNSEKYKEHHLRVQICNDDKKPDSSKAIFIGNLPFDVEDDDIWTVFDPCGPIISVRVIRDSKTNMGIGVAYVNFDSADSVELALQMENITVKNKVIRIHRYAKKSKHPRAQIHQQADTNNKNSKYKKVYKRPKNYSRNTNQTQANETGTTSIAVKNNVFQGSKSNLKKKKPKLNKSIINKMKLSKKILPK